MGDPALLFLTRRRLLIIVAIRVIGLGAELVVRLRPGRPLLVLLFHLFILQILNMSLEIGTAAYTTYVRPIRHKVAC